MYPSIYFMRLDKDVTIVDSNLLYRPTSYYKTVFKEFYDNIGYFFSISTKSND